MHIQHHSSIFNKKIILTSLIAVISITIIAGIFIALMSEDDKSTEATGQDQSMVNNTSQDQTEKNNQNEEKSSSVVHSFGRYRDYDKNLLDDEGYTQNIIFFHAPWCPECRAFEKVIFENEIPDHIQILKIDFDTSHDLRKKYDVTLQTTFVKVDKNGEKIKSWVGYEKEKSVNAIIENLK